MLDYVPIINNIIASKYELRVQPHEDDKLPKLKYDTVLRY